MLTRGFLCAICLLPPTILMGASLPAIVRWIETTPRGVSWWGLLYGGNTAGAVFGCLLAGFYLLRIYDTVVATYWAIAINLLVAAASYLVAGRVPAHGAAESQAEAEREAAAARRTRWTAVAGLTSPSGSPAPARSAPKWSGRASWAC